MMPGFVRRKRGLLLKIIIAVPLLWFSMIGFLVVMTGSSGSDTNRPDEKSGMVFRGVRENTDRVRTTKISLDHYPAVAKDQPDQPVLEQPNNDRMRLLERMREDAANNLRKNEQVLRENKDQKMKMEEPMNPFHDHILQNRVANEGPPKPQIDPNAPGWLNKFYTMHIAQYYRRSSNAGDRFNLVSKKSPN
jgi:hypothetical protein